MTICCDLQSPYEFDKGKNIVHVNDISYIDMMKNLLNFYSKKKLNT